MLHYLLPFILLVFILLHIYTLHLISGSNPLGLNISRINFNPYFTYKDIYSFLIYLLLFSLSIFYFPFFFNHSDNSIPANPLVTPSHIVPEFYLLPFYAILKSIPNKLLGVLGLLFSILVLFLYPYINISLIYNISFRPLYLYNISFFLFNFIYLGYIGSCIVESPYIIIGILLTIMHFY